MLKLLDSELARKFKLVNTVFSLSWVGRVATCKMQLNGMFSVHSQGSRPCKSLTIKIYMAYLEKFETSLV